MGCDNQPVFSALEDGKDECDLTNLPSGADGGGGWNPSACSYVDDIMSLPFVSVGYEQFPGHDIREYEIQPPELRMGGYGADSLMSSAVTSEDYGKSDIPMNFTPPRCEIGTGYPIKTHGTDALNSIVSRVQMSGKLPLKCSTSLLPLVDDFGARGDSYDVNSVPLSSSPPQKNDRNFLMLGNGSGVDVRPNKIFSTREISRKLEEASFQCNNLIAGHYTNNPANLTELTGGDATIQSNAVGLSRTDSNFYARKFPNKLEEVSHLPMNPMSLTQLSGGDARILPNSDFHAQAISSKLEGVSFQCNNNAGHYPSSPLSLTPLAGGAPIFQTNAGGLSRPSCNLASRMPIRVEGGLIEDAEYLLNSTQCPDPQKLQANIPSNTPNYTSVPLSTPLSLPSGSTLFSQPECSSQPEIGPTYFASQPISWLQDYTSKSSMKLSSESSRNYFALRHNQSSFGLVQPGDSSSEVQGTRTEDAKIGSFPSTVQLLGQFNAFLEVRPTEAPGNYISPERMSSKSGTYETAAGCITKGLGFQSNDFSTARSARGQFDAFHEVRPTEAPGNYVSPERMFSKSGTYETAAGCIIKGLGFQSNDFSTARSARGQFDAFHEVRPTEAPGNYVSPERIFSKSGTYETAAGCIIKGLGFQSNDFSTARSARGQFDAFHEVRPTEAPGNHISPERMFSESGTYKTAAGCFTKGLGFQSDDFSTARSARGPDPVHLATYHDHLRPLVPTVQHEMPAQSCAVFPRVDHSNGQVSPVAKLDVRPQVASITSAPSLKRKAFASPSAISSQQRTIPPPFRNDSATQERPMIPSIPVAVHVPPAPHLHIKWKGSDEPLEPTGQRCLLCKRDLSFTAEGEGEGEGEGVAYRPTAPPPVAVLPCGHTFHDHCLQIITPEDQLKNPPCIPCAVGEA